MDVLKIDGEHHPFSWSGKRIVTGSRVFGTYCNFLYCNDFAYTYNVKRAHQTLHCQEWENQIRMVTHY